MQTSIQKDVAERGYVFFDSLRVGMDTTTLANALGRPMIPWHNGLVQDLVPRATATPNTYSGIYGLNRFPFHTDLAHWRNPPRYLLLRCITGHLGVPTLLIDARAIYDAIGVDILGRAIFRPRRPLDGKLSLLRLYERTDAGECFRWDEMFIKPASRIGQTADCRVREEVGNSTPWAVTLASRGDTLLIDNWRMLHARSSIPLECKDRQLQRIYLERLH
jgi:hypothetical protein